MTKRQRGGWAGGGMLMPLHSGTGGSAAVRRMGQRKGGRCEENAHKRTLRIGEQEGEGDREAASVGPHVQCGKQVQTTRRTGAQTHDILLKPPPTQLRQHNCLVNLMC